MAPAQGSALILCLLIAAPAAAQELSTPDQDPPPDARGPEDAPAPVTDTVGAADLDEAAHAPASVAAAEPLIEGSIWTRYRSRTATDEWDGDLFSGIALTLRPAGWLDAYLKADLFVDAGRDHDERDQLWDIWDTWDGSAQGRLQEAWVRLHSEEHELRLGRQLVYRARTLHFDGASAALRPTSWLTLRALGGLPVYEYESPWRGDVVAAAGLDLTPTRWTQLSVDYIHATDARDGVYHHEDLLAVSGRQNLGPYVVVRGAGEVLEEEVRSAEGSLTITPPCELRLSGRYYALFDAQRAQGNEFDLYTAALGPANPHQGYELGAWKGIGGVVGLEVFFEQRDFDEDEGREGLWNRDFLRWGGRLSIYDLPTLGTTLSATYEQYQLEDTDDGDTRQVSGELDWRANDALRLGIGSSYMLYTYDRRLAVEREHVRVYWARVVLRLGGHRVDARYAYEDDEDEDFHTAQLGWRHDF